MRDILFLAAFLPMPFICFFRPWLGMLIWTWFAFTFPLSSLWGIGTSIPGNILVTLFTLIGWVLAKDEPKRLPLDRANLLLIAFALVTSVSIMLSLSPEHTEVKISEYASIFIYLMMLSMFLHSTERLHAYVWITAFSIAYYAVKSSASFVVTRGAHHSTGPVGTILEDNNHLAVAFLLVFPLLNYLRLHSRYRWVRLCLLGTMVLTALAVVSTFSRGGFIGLVCMLGYFWWNAGRKISHLLLIGLGLLAVIYTSSDSWTSRMQSIDSAHEEDASFQGRLGAWLVYWNAALDRPLTGAGPKALEDPEVSHKYRPPLIDLREGIAGHSIYFQLMGEEGFLALGIYLAMLYTAWANGGWVARRARGDPDLAWARDLARMAQISIVVFAVTAAALSLAFFDLLLSIMIVLAALRRMVAARLVEAAETASPPAGTPLMRPAEGAG
ncbi:MAG: putative O-glycosylation ligase, exosortase A system-associated [Geminicoccaceae bacterium]